MRDAQITLPWADGDYTFRLGWGELELLQEACNAGPYVILNRLMTEQWLIGDVSHTIRLGLMGGGLKPSEALKKVRDYVEKRPPLENLLLAQAIISAGLTGAPEEGEVGESEAASQDSSSTTSPTES